MKKNDIISYISHAINPNPIIPAAIPTPIEIPLIESLTASSSSY